MLDSRWGSVLLDAVTISKARGTTPACRFIPVDIQPRDNIPSLLGKIPGIIEEYNTPFQVRDADVASAEVEHIVSTP